MLFSPNYTYWVTRNSQEAGNYLANGIGHLHAKQNRPGSNGPQENEMHPSEENEGWSGY